MSESKTYDQKATNPKDAIGIGKLPLDLVPETGIAYAALAFLEGALKYGKFNWRIAGVRWSVYEAALKRHMAKVNAGEWEDPVTGVPHIASMLACLMIAADAKEAGKLIDDRPPRVEGFSKFIDGLTAKVAHLKALFREHNPKQYTIYDGVEGELYGPGKQANPSDTSKAEPEGTPGKDAQPVPGRDSGRLVFRDEKGPLGGIQVGYLGPKDSWCGDSACTFCLAAGLVPGSAL